MSKIDKTTIQARLAVASFACGVILASICLFFVEPYGEIHSSAISIVSELLLLSGALLGIKSSFDAKMNKFESELRDTKTKINQPTKNEI